jgi:hypothetical protein
MAPQMGWTKDGRYYQRSVRRNGRVVSEYYGSGAAAVAVWIMDGEAREARREAQAAARAAEAEERRLFSEERTLGRSVRLLVECGIEGMGYAKYDRHQWRRRRMKTDLACRGEADPGPPTATEIRALAEKVKAKEPGSYQQFREVAARYPAEVVASLRLDLANLARETLAAKALAGNGAHEIALLTQMRLIAEGLAGPNPGLALQLAAAEAAWCWALRWSLACCQAKRGIETSTPAQLRRAAAASREYLRALKVCQRMAEIEGRDS